MAQPLIQSALGQTEVEEDPYVYKAFLSYSHKDEVRAARLHRRLERYRIPKNLRQNGPTLGKIFRDKEELSVASVLDKSIEKALRDSESLIVLCSPEAVRSQWVDKEIAYFKSLGRENRIFAVIISGIPNAKTRGFPSEWECLPKSLRYDLTETGDIIGERRDPLATDLRREGDGKRLGFIKLVSGLMGLSLDQFLQRQLVHARRRSMGILVASSALISIFAGLAWATHSAQLRAEARTADAENFVEFLLSDLSLQLETYGRLDLLDSVGVKAVDYYAQFEENELDAQTSGRRARTFHFMGELQHALAKTENSEAYFDEAYALTQKGFDGDPNNPDRVYEHARSAYFKSLPLRRMVDYPGELIQLEIFSDLSARLAELEKGSPRSLTQLALVATNIGRVKLRTNAMDEALQNLTKADVLFRELNAAEPSIKNLLLRTENLAWLAEYHKVLENHESNVEIRQRQNALIDERLTLHPDDFRLIEASVYAKIGLAGSASYLGLKAESKRYFQSALNGTEAALRLEPRREKMRRAQSIILYSLMKEAIFENNKADYKRAEAKLSKLMAETLSTSTDENKYWDEVLPGLISGLKSDFD
jgi:tetratricopeptide (TPR) repeat protein